MTITPRKPNAPPKSLTLSEVAALVEGELAGDRNLVITGVAGLQDAEKGDITFLANAKYLPFLRQTRASAVIVPKETQARHGALIRSENPSQAFTRIVTFFMPQDERKEAGGIHPAAVIAPGVHLGKDVFVGANAVLEEDAAIGDRSRVDAGVFIGRGARIGKDSRIYPNVVIREKVKIGDRVLIHSGAVIGSDGFGYESVEGRLWKIPQLGSVEIGDDVEIGSNVCIDRGRFRDTRVEHGTKIDNLVQIGHNTVVGPDCVIVSQAGISGSAQIGKNVIIAGQAGLVGHIRVGDQAVIGAQAGVTKDVPEKSTILGSPAKPIQEQKKIFALVARLPEFFKDLSEIKKKLGL